MPLIKVYNNDSDLWRLKGHFIFKSVRPFVFGYAVAPKLRERCLRHHVQAASAEAVSFCRTFGDEAWSQQIASFQSAILHPLCVSGPYSHQTGQTCQVVKTNSWPSLQTQSGAPLDRSVCEIGDQFLQTYPILLQMNLTGTEDVPMT
jgi:hypothetical protein